MDDKRTRGRIPALLLAFVVLISVFVVPSAMGDEPEPTGTPEVSESVSEEPQEEVEEPTVEPTEEPVVEETETPDPVVTEAAPEEEEVEVVAPERSSTIEVKNGGDAATPLSKSGALANPNPGNTGTVMVNGQDIDSGGNDPHTTCSFQLDFFNFSPVGGTATYEFTLQAPTGSGQITSGSVTFAAPDGSGKVASSGEIELGPLIQALGVQPQSNGEYHIQVLVTTPNGTKSKTYWVQGCSADLQIAKTDSQDPVQVGGAFSYGLTVTNNGPTGALSVSVADTLPNKVTFVSSTASVGSYNSTTGIWTIGDMAPDAVETLTINVLAALPGTASNTAAVSSDTFDPVTTNNSDTEDTVITALPSADLSITKTDSVDPVTVGDGFSYTIQVTNNGPDQAVNVSVADTLPSHVDEDTTQTHTFSHGTLTVTSDVIDWDIGTLASGGTATATIYVVAKNTGTAQNTATVSSDTTDPDPLDNSDTENTTINAVPSADLSITKSDSADPVKVGDGFSYTIQVTNNGPDQAVNVSVADTLPSHVDEDTTQTHTFSHGTLTVTSDVIDWDIGTLASGGTATATIYVVAKNTGTAQNTATVSSDTADPDPLDDSDTEDTTIDPVADVAITKSDSADPVKVGDGFSYTLQVTNNGPSTAQNVSVDDTLPGEVDEDTSQTHTADQGTVTVTGDVVDWDIGTLASGDTVTATIYVTAVADGTASNTASVDTTTFDDDSTNDDDTENTTIDPVADVSITKSDSADPVKVGDGFSYTLQVTNNGPSTAQNISVDDTLPAEVDEDTTQTHTFSHGTLTVTGDVVDWDIGSLAPNTSATATIYVIATSPGTASNTASVDTTTFDDDSTNDSDTEDTTIDPVADVAITKSDSADPVKVGDGFSYTLQVTNNGPSTAQNVSVDDTLPGEVDEDTSQTHTADQGTVSVTGDVVDWDIGTLASGDTVTATIYVTAVADGTASNTASVDTTTFDDDSTNDDDTEDTTIDPVADLSITQVDSPDPVEAGGSITYAMTVKNNGPNVAKNVLVLNDLPPGTLFESADNGGGLIEDLTQTQRASLPQGVGLGTIAWALGDLAPGEEKDLQLVLGVKDKRVDDIENQASVSGTTFDPDLSNNMAASVTGLAALPPAKGRIIVLNRSIPAGSDQAFTYSGDVSANLSHGETAVEDVDAGTYAVTQNNVRGWALKSVVCDDGDSTASRSTRTATFRVTAGETVTCTFVNEEADVLVLPPPEKEPEENDPTAKRRPTVLARRLPFTGTELVTFVWLATILMATGAGAYASSRRRRSEERLAIEADE